MAKAISELDALTVPASGDLMEIVDISDTSMSANGTNKKITRDNFFVGWDSWQPAGEAWTYASANTFTVPGDVTAKYAKGTRIKWTQTTVKYGTVANSVYSAPNTTVTTAVNTDYTIANAAISSNFISYANPPDYPHWFNYTPTYSASGSMTFTSVTTALARFCVVGSMCNLVVQFLGTTGGTASNRIYFSAPTLITPFNGTLRNTAVAFDTADTSGMIYAEAGGGGTLFSAVKFGIPNWGLGALRGMSGQIFYPIG
jgi:hypothetical protein